MSEARHEGRTDVRGRLAEAGQIAGWAVVAAPLGLILHELGHFVAARALGFDPQMGSASVSGGARLGTAADWMVAVQASAGPLVTLLLLLAAWAALRSGRMAHFAFALAATAPLRFLVGASYLFFRTLAWLRGEPPGQPNFDEFNLARAMDLPPELLAAAGTAILIATWLWLWRRTPRGRRILASVAVVVGAAAGLFLWVHTAGPIFADLVNSM